MTHKCKLPHCDGTRLGHELARDFPKETARVYEAFIRMANREDYVMPENLQVDPEEPARLDMWVVYQNPTDFEHGMDGDLYVLRHWIATGAGPKPDRDVIADVDLEKVRAQIPPGSVRLERPPHEDPAILEVWV